MLIWYYVVIRSKGRVRFGRTISAPRNSRFLPWARLTYDAAQLSALNLIGLVDSKVLVEKPASTLQSLL